eukprot:CAMPEP_0113888754 /NCGR_PEP_ID=MMETSP0780_2-20120614/13063_1 /TAXON_ID=652834 /ORGANISM="Palpitomonas bilix" /LENGTH=121 /DNA_ID=CAMNT_0000877669 /DNA_START=488 /DNA_END=850 /DNA_ORIENTATION=+ /assembly_acc=CAM_ASM_000599
MQNPSKPLILSCRDNGFKDFDFSNLLKNLLIALRDIQTVKQAKGRGTERELEEKVKEFKKAIDLINARYKKCIEIVEEVKGMGMSKEEYEEKSAALTKRIDSQREALNMLSRLRLFAAKVE